jgi:hypothetical protein
MTFYIVQVFVFYKWASVAESLNGLLGIDIVNIYFFFNEIRPWHIARLVNCFMTVGLFLYADTLQRQFDSESPFNERLPMNCIRGLTFVRSLLGLYTILCAVWILVTTIDWTKLPFNWTISPWL